MSISKSLSGTAPAESQVVCSCGNIFMTDTKFCRKCGSRASTSATFYIDREAPDVQVETSSTPSGYIKATE